MNLCLFDLDDTLIPLDSDHAWGEFVIRLGWVEEGAFRRRNDAFYEQYKAGTLDIYEFLAFQLAPLARHPRAKLDAWHREYLEHHIRPIMTALASLQGQYARSGPPVALAGALLVSIPTFVLFFAVQRVFVRGLRATA